MKPSPRFLAVALSLCLFACDRPAPPDVLVPPPNGGGDCRELGNACGGVVPICDLATGICRDGPSPYPSNELLYSFYAGFDATSLTEPELDLVFGIAASDLGLKYLKVGFRWVSFEPQKDAFVWTGGDMIARLAQKHGLSVVAFFPQTGTPPWAEKEPVLSVTCARGMTRITRSAEENAGFIGAFMDRYAESMAIEYVELENEPNAPCLWPDTAAWLATVDNAVYARVKASHPAVKVCSASLHQPLGLGGENLADENAYTDSFFGEYLTNLAAIDCFSLHDYGLVGLTQTSDLEYSTQYDLESNVRALLDGHGKAGVPIIHTECAYPPEIYGGDEALGAAYLSQSYLLAHAKGSVSGRMCQGIAPGVVGRARGDNWGIADVQGGAVTYRDGYYAFKTLRSVMARFPKHVRQVKGAANDPDHFVEQFVGPDGADLIVLFVPMLKSGATYPAPAAQSATLQLGAGQTATVTASDGAQTSQVADAAGNVTLSVGAQPVFVEVR